MMQLPLLATQGDPPLPSRLRRLYVGRALSYLFCFREWPLYANRMSYTPDMDKTVDERIETYLNTTDEAHRAFEIADKINSKTGYTRRRCNQLYEDEELQKFWGSPVVGHPMPDGSTKVLVNNRQVLLNIVQQYRPQRLAEAQSKSTIKELRSFIEEEIAVGSSHPLGNRKVSYGTDIVPDAGKSSGTIANAD